MLPMRVGARCFLLHVAVYGKPVPDAFCERHFIGEFKFPSKGNTPGNGGELELGVVEFFPDIINGCVSLYGGAQGENYFFCCFLAGTCYKGFDGQLIRTNAIQWGNDPPQYMVQATVLFRGFNGNDVADIFHYADGITFSGSIAANRAKVVIGDVEALFAEPDFPPHAQDGFTELGNCGLFLLEQVQHQPQSCFLTDPR